jgi:hypothetical protein
MATKQKKKAKGTTDKNEKTVEKYSYNAEELKRIRIYIERVENKPIKFKFKKGKSGNLVLNLAEEDNPLWHVQRMEALGSPDGQLQTFFLNQVIQTFQGGVSSEGFDNSKLEEFLNNTMMILHDISPKDVIEGMLAFQMVGVHNLAMECLKRSIIKDQTFEGKQANVNQAAKMLRTYILQMETLKKYRTGGHQKVTVEHVNVHRGGQAIVGSFNHKGGGKVEK